MKVIYKDIFRNGILGIALFSYIFSCIIKVVFFYIKEKKFSMKKFWEPGGMPSSHSALVMSLSTSVGKIRGFDSLDFAMIFVISLIVMYDASGVRRAAGQQATVINKIVEAWYESDPFEKRIKLKELLGHTPLEVLAGAIFGVVVAVLSFRFIPLTIG
ncbi:MAG: divergent PAP2 family protein [Clostridiales bacterium]|nr:divergent PAP2 family protein [Clostridiales bacterium]